MSMFKTRDGWVKIFEEKDVLAIPPEPECVMEDSLCLDEACSDLAYLVREAGLLFDGIDRVVGFGVESLTVADGLARSIAMEKTSGFCFRSCIKENLAIAGETTFLTRPVQPGEKVLLCVDILRSPRLKYNSERIMRAVQLITKAKGIVLPVVAVLLNCSDLLEIDRRKIVSLVNYSAD